MSEKSPWDELPPIAPDSILEMSIVFYGLMFLLAAFIAAMRKSREFVEACSVEAILYGLALGLLIAVLSRPLKYFEAFAALFEVLGRILGPQTNWSCAALALSSGFAEEALFRGALQPWIGIYFTAALFGIIHSPFLLGPGAEELKHSLRIWPAFAFVVGLFFGWLTQYTNTWLSAAAAHGMVNYLNLRYICGNEALNAGSGPENPTGLS